MLDFMVIGLPRSGTTWAANWLTTEATHCLHDPLYSLHYAQWDACDRFPAGRLRGVSCTGIWRWPAWVDRHPARKLILHRDLAEVRASLAALGHRDQVDLRGALGLWRLKGLHADWRDLFDPDRAERLWRHLTGLPFDRARHRELAAMNIQPHPGVAQDSALQRRLYAELQRSNQPLSNTQLTKSTI